MAARHLYLRDYSKANKHPLGCVATEVDRSTNEIRYAISTCSPLDKYNVNQARDKASGRLVAYPAVIKCEIPKTGHEITKLIMEHIVKTNQSQRSTPQGEAAKDWRNHRHYLALEAAQGWLAQSKQQA